MRKRKDKGEVKPDDGAFTLTWKDLIDPKDRKHVTKDIDNVQPYDWDSEQAPE